ncbi:MAG: DNA polymerase I [Desulfococcaceae bacterium]
MSHDRTLYLIDGSAYLYRAFHAIRGGLSNSRGMPTNVAFGFTRMLLKLMDEKAPEHLAVLFDVKGPTFRHERYPEYKANRPPAPDDLVVQIPWVKDITRAFNIPLLEKEGFEADDLIGTLARQAESAGYHVVMVTGDKDFLQLVTEKTRLWDPMKEVETGPEEVREKFGLEPSDLVDVMGLSGDTSDNVPGVPGIGPKTAAKLIRDFGSMEKLYENVETIKAKKQKENLTSYRDQAFLSRELVTIRTDAPVDFDPETFQRQEPDAAALSRIFQELEFRGLQDRFPMESDQTGKTYTAVTTEAELDALVEKLRAAEIVSVDTETTSPIPMRAKLVGLSFAAAPDVAFYVPCGHADPETPQLPMETVLDRLRPVLEDPTVPKVGQNIKYDDIVLRRHGVRLEGIAFDTMVGSYLLKPGQRTHGLDQIARDLLDYRTITYEEVAGKGKDAVTFDRVSLDKAAPYACEDADVTRKAWEILRDRLAEQKLDRLMEAVEVPLLPVLSEMEYRGIRVDRDRLEILAKDFGHQLEVLEGEIHGMAGAPFNINSPQQLGHILFEKLGLPTQKKTKKKTGYSTDVEVLTALAEKHELPALILRHRGLAKLKSTYVEALVELIHPETGRIHTSYNQTVTATGRLSSSEPNLQNIPIRTPEGVEIRRTFIPAEGWTLIAGDYSQVELRLLAHYSDDPILIRAFRENEDIHTRTAAEIFQVFPEMITPDLRRQAKTINFGIIYGMSAFRLSKELGISRKMAQTYIDHYFGRYPGVKSFIDRTIENARKTRRTATLLGRLRELPDIDAKNPTVRQFAERTAVNTPIQGTAADLIKLAMIRAHRALRERRLKAGMLLTVHDELVFEAPPEEVDIVIDLARAAMENVWEEARDILGPDEWKPLRVPLEVNIDTGDNWAAAH